MALSMRVTFDDREVQRALRQVNNDMPNAVRRAINRTLSAAKTEASKRIREHRSLKKRIVDRAIRVRRANYKELTGSISVSSAPISLKHYGARQRFGRGFQAGRGVDNRGRKARGAGIEVRVSKGRKTVLKHAFIGPNGHVYSRVGGRGSARLPIRPLMGPSLGTAMVRDDVVRALQEKTRAVLLPRLRHEIDFELRKAWL